MTESQRLSLGQLIRETREKRGMSLRALAKKSGHTHRWLTKIENGKLSRPDPIALAQIAVALGISGKEMNLASGGMISEQLPRTRTYLRAKHEFSEREAAEVEAVVARIYEERGWERHQI